jgi:hypothetical protein
LEEKTKSKLRFSKTSKIILGIIAIAAVAGVAAFVTFTQYFPAVPTGTPTANLVPNCGTSTPGDVLTFTPATVVAGQPFAITYSCSGGAAAITVTSGPITKIPTEAPAIGAGGMPTTLSLIAPGVTCTPTAGIQLTQSVAATIPTGSYNYCATGTTAPVTGVVSFTVAWA